MIKGVLTPELPSNKDKALVVTSDATTPITVTAKQTSGIAEENQQHSDGTETHHAANKIPTPFPSPHATAETETPGAKIPTPFPSQLNAENDTTNTSSRVIGTGDAIDTSPSGVTGTEEDDAFMEDTTQAASGGSTQDFQDGKDLPPWLNLTIGYLRGLTEDVAWQTLITDFITFQRQQPTNGVGSLFLTFAYCPLADYNYLYE